MLAASAVYLPLPLLNEGLPLSPYVGAIAVGVLLSGRFWSDYGARFHILSWTDAAQMSARQNGSAALTLFTLLVATKDAAISRAFLGAYFASCFVLLILVNKYVPIKLARLAFPIARRIPTLLIGSSAHVPKLRTWLAQKEHLGIRIIGIAHSEDDARCRELTGPYLGASANIEEIVETRGVGQVLLLEIPTDQAEMVRIIAVCQSAGCRLLVYHDLLDQLPLRLSAVIEEGHLFLTAHDEPLEDPFNRALKRASDIALSLPVVALVLPPLCLVVAAIQRLQAPGPLLFARPRGGQLRRQFNMLKFRSMYAAEPDPSREAEQARSGDSRIYPFGFFLRKTSLDEFPQFWNVLIGDMSIVGPRPHLPRHDEEFSRVAKTYRTRHLVKPGITGLAQVNGFRGEITDPSLLESRVQKDIEYITTWSMWLDIQIVIRTVWQVVRPPKSAR
jgi:exopolysaccharide biosynthesis polyprenyl glycosylphosphotransferase